MPTPESTACGGAGPVAAVLDVLAVPAARQALLLEQALAAQMAVFAGAPPAADFDPLARSAISAAPRAARPQSGAARRKAAAAKPGEPGAGPGFAGIGAAAAVVLQAATQSPPPAQSMLTEIAAAVAALTAPDGPSPRRPSPPAPEGAVRSATLGTLGAVPMPESTAPGSAGPVAAVRTVLDALAVPAARQALLLEQALAAQMAVFAGAPPAADFDPLARSAISAAPRAARPQSGAARRKAAAAKPGEPGAGPGFAGIGAAAAAVLQAATQPPPPAQSMLTEIAAAVAALTAPDGTSPRRPSPPSPEGAVRSATLGALGAVEQTAHVAATALDAAPGAGVTAPVLERIAEIGGALWLQVALSPPGQASSSSATADNGARARVARPASRVADRAATGGGASSLQRLAVAAGAASREATSPVETVTNALAGIGRLTVELFGAAARAGTPDLLGTAARPAPRAPNVLTPQRAPESTSRPASGPSATATPGVAIDADALARALRAEAELRGVAL